MTLLVLLGLLLPVTAAPDPVDTAIGKPTSVPVADPLVKVVLPPTTSCSAMTQSPAKEVAAVSAEANVHTAFKEAASEASGVTAIRKDTCVAS